MTVINRAKRFIYLKSHKTASSSVEVYLITSTSLGRDIYYTTKDIYNFNGRDDGPKRHYKNKYKVPLVDCWFDFFKDFDFKSANRLFPRVKQHQSAAEVMSIVGREFWNESLVSTSIRNPWDAVVSFYNWVKIGRYRGEVESNISWEEFLAQALKPRKGKKFSLAQEYLFYPYVFVEGKCICDHVFCFEDLEASSNELSARLDFEGISFDRSTFAYKISRNVKDYRTYYTDEQAELVGKGFKEFLDEFHYSFDQIGAPPKFTPC